MCRERGGGYDLKGQMNEKKMMRRYCMIMVTVCLLALLTAALIVHMKQITDKIDPQPALRIYSPD